MVSTIERYVRCFQTLVDAFARASDDVLVCNLDIVAQDDRRILLSSDRAREVDPIYANLRVHDLVAQSMAAKPQGHAIEWK